MNAIKNITVGHTERLRKPVGYTMLANLVNIVPFCLSIEAINVIFRTFDGSGTPLDTNRLWMIFAILVVYMVVMAFAERAAYHYAHSHVYYVSTADEFLKFLYKSHSKCFLICYLLYFGRLCKNLRQSVRCANIVNRREYIRLK